MSKEKQKPDELNPDHEQFNPESYAAEIPEEASLSPGEKKKASFLASSKLRIFGPDYFYNYELSWLDFNYRVLDEARRDEHPLLERIKFIGIVCSNLDEFFQKRVGGLKRQVGAGVNLPSIDGLTPAQQLVAIRDTVRDMIQQYRSCFFDQLLPLLEKEGIRFKTYPTLSKKEQKKAREYFQTQLYPIMTPLAVDQAHPFPFISNKSRSFAVEILDPKTGEEVFARVKVPNNRPRWFQVSESKNEATFINIDEIIREHIGDLFPGAAVQSAHIFRVTRNADLQRNEEEADDLLELIEDELRERRFAEVVRLEVDVEMPQSVKELLTKKMGITKSDIFEMQGSVGLADAMQLGKIKNFDHLKFSSWTPTLHPSFRHAIEEEKPGVFEVIRKGDIMVHHPYHSFSSSVERFVKEAASDPNVLAIKQTLYRTSPDSALMHSLMKAVEAGKQVAVLVELKARFDEQQNIEWAMKLEKAGIHVSYGLPGLKIHSKITVVVREEGEKLRRYAHVGTGNYHPGTANLYEDLGLFTCDPAITADVSALFNFLTGYAPDQTYKKLMVAPHHLRRQMMAYIDAEIKEAQAGREARIIMKMNSLEDPYFIQRLYYASTQGVAIDLIVRGICRLRPGVKKMSENIRVHSIIGRFLEHSRIFYFRNAGNHSYLIGSADIMHRNLDARVEAITPIENSRMKKYLRFMLSVYLQDNKQRWMLDENGRYNRVSKSKEESEIATQKLLMSHTASLREPIPMHKPE